MKQVVTRQPTSFGEEISKAENVSQVKSKQVEGLNGKDLNLALTFAIEEVANKVQKKGNKFTEGLDLSQFDDWASELRPSMKKLRQGLSLLISYRNFGSRSAFFCSDGHNPENCEDNSLSSKTATRHKKDFIELGHHVPEGCLFVSSGKRDTSKVEKSLNPIIFQLTTLVTALMAKFWGSQIDEHYVKVICTLGPLIYFEGYLSVS